MPETLFTHPGELTNHPDLDRVMLVGAVAGHLAENHHGDETRKESAGDLADDWASFVQSIRDEGVIEPVKVLEGTKWVVDGRHRLAAAQEAELAVIPFREVTQEQADRIIEATVIGRRHWTKSMRAYFAVLRHPEVADPEAAAARQKRGGPAQNAGGSPADLAKRYGVSLRLVEQAIEVYRTFEKKPKLRASQEPGIWAGLSLGGILSGIGGAEATKDKPKKSTTPASTAPTLATLKGQLRAYPTWTAAQKDAFLDEFEEMWRDIEGEARDAILEVIQDVARSAASE